MAPIKKLSATSFIRRSATRRWASASGSAPANDSAKDARARRTGVAGVITSSPGARAPDGSALCATTPSCIARAQLAWQRRLGPVQTPPLREKGLQKP